MVSPVSFGFLLFCFVFFKLNTIDNSIKSFFLLVNRKVPAKRVKFETLKTDPPPKKDKKFETLKTNRKRKQERTSKDFNPESLGTDTRKRTQRTSPSHWEFYNATNVKKKKTLHGPDSCLAIQEFSAGSALAPSG